MTTSDRGLDFSDVIINHFETNHNVKKAIKVAFS